MTTIPLHAQPTAVYRLFTESSELLYIGISNDPRARFSDHRAEKTWWSDVNRATVKWCPDRTTALRREARAIAAENPRYNIDRPNPDCIREPRIRFVEPVELPRMTFEQAAAVMYVQPEVLRRGVARGRCPHSCNRTSVWFTPANLRDLQALCRPHLRFGLGNDDFDEEHHRVRRAAKRALWLRCCPHAA